MRARIIHIHCIVSLKQLFQLRQKAFVIFVFRFAPSRFAECGNAREVHVLQFIVSRNVFRPCICLNPYYMFLLLRSKSRRHRFVIINLLQSGITPYCKRLTLRFALIIVEVKIRSRRHDCVQARLGSLFPCFLTLPRHYSHSFRCSALKNLIPSDCLSSFRFEILLQYEHETALQFFFIL